MFCLYIHWKHQVNLFPTLKSTLWAISSSLIIFFLIYGNFDYVFDVSISMELPWYILVGFFFTVKYKLRHISSFKL